MESQAETALGTGFKKRRLIQVFWAVTTTIVLTGLFYLLIGEIELGLECLAGAAAILPVYVMAKTNRSLQGAAYLLFALTIFVSFMMLMNQGLRDETLLAFPGILVFSAIIGNKRLFIYLLLFMLVVVMALGFANSFGIWTNEQAGAGLFSSFVISVILGNVAFSIYILSSDLAKALKQLSLENQQVKKSQSEISHLVHHDALTNLPNRVLAQDRFNQALMRAERSNKQVGIMFIDLDNFKTINDSLGHQAGDHLLKELAFRLSRIVRKSDTVCRMGGDEFLIILNEVGAVSDTSDIAQKILRELEQPFSLQNEVVSSTCSIGIALAPEDGHNFDTLLKHADLAMYHAKDAGRNHFSFFDEIMNVNAREHMHVITEMRSAIPGQEFELYYQPKIDLQHNTIIGAEALIRWNHPSRGLVFPGDFIDLAERSGLIVELGEWIISEACKACRLWHDLGHDHLHIAVNVSSTQLKRSNLMAFLKREQRRNGLAPNALEIELTESTLMDDSPALQQGMAAIRDMGMSFSIDDFGTGYSNFAYLKQFDVGTLKIDRSFVTNVLVDPQDEAIVKAIINISSSMDVQTVAEGIEDYETALKLKSLSCHVGQGYYWSRALPMAEFLQFLQKPLSPL